MNIWNSLVLAKPILHVNRGVLVPCIWDMVLVQRHPNSLYIHSNSSIIRKAQESRGGPWLCIRGPHFQRWQFPRQELALYGPYPGPLDPPDSTMFLPKTFLFGHALSLSLSLSRSLSLSLSLALSRSNITNLLRRPNVSMGCALVNQGRLAVCLSSKNGWILILRWAKCA